MSLRRIGTVLLWCYVVTVFAFIMAPIATSFIVSFNFDRFPTLPLGAFSLRWYQDIAQDPMLPPAFRNTIIVGFTVSVIATTLGFAAAYTDYRYRFAGKQVYLALKAIIISHIVVCLPFAMALIRLRLSQMDQSLEAAAWNLGATEWRAMRDVILPFTLPAILAALFITMAVSFDEYAIAWFVSGFQETLPVRILAMFQGQVSPRINAIGSIVFTITMTLVILAQAILLLRRPARAPDQVNT
jgi:spermidine/putrescine transport system permease protein